MYWEVIALFIQCSLIHQTFIIHKYKLKFAILCDSSQGEISKMICTVQTVSYKFKVSFKEFGSIVCTEGMHLFT
jgi:hypothetical protein